MVMDILPPPGVGVIGSGLTLGAPASLRDGIPIWMGRLPRGRILATEPTPAMADV